MSDTSLWQTVLQCLYSLSSEEGIYASGKDEAYGCIFGRDSAITVLKILKALQHKFAFSHQEETLLYTICQNTLYKLVTLQGTKITLESGEEPGKFIHEYRKDNYERLIKCSNPWYVYPDGILRNYDSIDGTPLCLIALYKYWKQTQDPAFLMKVLPSVDKGLHWIMEYGDCDNDYLLEYEFNKARKFGGLKVQSWTDSYESLLNEKGLFPPYPIAPAEVQGYAWLALRLWADFYSADSSNFVRNKYFADHLIHFAKNMKTQFNKSFILNDQGYSFSAQALDGNKQQIKTITGNPLLLLWSSYLSDNGTVESIIDSQYIPDIVKRAFKNDLFEPAAGIRTMSTQSKTFDSSQRSYHNGSFWPKLNGLSHEGLTLWKYHLQAQLLKEATLTAVKYFGTPIELYIKTRDGSYLEYKSITGQVSCRQQAWSAASVLDLLTYKSEHILPII